MATANTTLDLLCATVREQDESAATALATCIDTYRAAVRVEVTGRAGVGRTALVAALGPIPGAEIVETTAWDRPDAEDPVLGGEIIVVAVLDPPRSADRAAATAAGDRLVPVLAKADTLADVARSLERVADLLGVACLPVGGIAGPSVAAAGVGELRAEIVDRVLSTRAGRAAHLLRRIRDLDRVPALREPADEFTASGQGVRVSAAAAAGREIDGDALTRARHWQAMAAVAPDAAAARAALARQRAAVRDWIGDD